MYVYFTAGPKPVELVNTTVLSDTSVNVVWQPSDSNVDEYIIDVVGDDGVEFKIRVPGNETSRTVNTLMERTNYNLTVFAVRNGVESTPSSTVSITTFADGTFEVFFYAILFTRKCLVLWCSLAEFD